MFSAEGAGIVEERAVVRLARVLERSVCTVANWERSIVFGEAAIYRDSFNSMMRASQTMIASCSLARLQSRCKRSLRSRAITGSQGGVVEATRSGDRNWWVMTAGSGEGWRAGLETERTGIEARATGREVTVGVDEKFTGKPSAQFVTEIVETSKDPRRKTWETVTGTA